MSEPTSQLTVLQLATRIAKEAGNAYRGVNGTSKAMPPVNTDDLEDIKQVINDGIRQFIADAPATGWQWRKRILQVNISNTRIEGVVDSASPTTIVDTTLAATYDEDDELNGYWFYVIDGTGKGSYAQITDYDATSVPGTVTVADWLDQYGNAGGTDPVATDTFAITKYETVGGDVARYPLPENFGGEINGPISYSKDATHSQETYWVPESTIRTQRQGGSSSGYPYMAALRQYEPASSSLGPKRRYELLLYPDPSQDDILEFPYVLVFNGIDMETGLATSASETTLVDTARDEPADYFNGWKIDILDGTGKGSYAVVTDYANGGSFAVADWLGGANPATDSVYFVHPVNNLHPAGIKFDEVVKASCLSEAEQFFQNIQAGHIEKYIQKALPKAYESDARSSMFIKIGNVNPYIRTWNLVEKDDE